MLRVACPACTLVHTPPPVPRSARAHLRCVRCDHRFAPPDEARVPTEAPPRCARHTAVSAAWRCGECAAAYCDRCGEAVSGQPGRDGIRWSPCCRAPRVPIARVEIARPFWEDPAKVLLWPLRRAGVVMLVMFWLASFVPLLSWLAVIVLAAYLQHVLRASARGATHLPPYPVIDNLVTDVVYPFGRLLGVVLVLWGPAIVYRQWTDAPANDPVVWALRSIPILLGPFAITAASVARSSRVLLDVPLMGRVLLRIAPDYVVTWLFLVALLLLVGALGRFSANSDTLVLVHSAVRYYALFLGFHVIGWLVLQTRHRVDWEV